MTEENIDKAMATPEKIVKVLGSLLLTSLELGKSVLTLSTDIVLEVASIPGRFIGALVAAPFLGFTELGTSRVFHGADQLLNGSGIKSSLDSMKKSGMKEVTDFTTSHMTKK